MKITKNIPIIINPINKNRCDYACEWNIEGYNQERICVLFKSKELITINSINCIEERLPICIKIFK